MEPIFHSIQRYISALQFLAKISFREIGILGQFSLSLSCSCKYTKTLSIRFDRAYVYILKITGLNKSFCSRRGVVNFSVT